MSSQRNRKTKSASRVARRVQKDKARKERLRKQAAHHRSQASSATDVEVTSNVHGAYVASRSERLLGMLGSAGTGDAAKARLAAEFDRSLARVVNDLAQFDPLDVIDAGRRAALPMMVGGHYEPTAGAQAAIVELLALVVLAANHEPESSGPRPQTLSPANLDETVEGVLGVLEDLFLNAQARSMLDIDPADKMSRINAMVHGSQVLVRNSSYADMVEPTVIAILDGNHRVREYLKHQFGFDAHDAVAVLNTVHELQQDQLNRATHDSNGPFAAQLQEMFASGQLIRRPEVDARRESDGEAAEGSDVADVPAEWRTTLDALFASAGAVVPEPPTRDATGITVVDIVRTGTVPEATARSVLAAFTLAPLGDPPSRVVDAFVTGDNPLRVRPLLGLADGTVVLPHDTLSMGAVKENLEGLLKDSPMWETYQNHRGAHLEARVGAAFAKILPGAQVLSSYEYFVPHTPEEDSEADPSKYTRRVEGDHLVLVDDVAFIVEDKAGALSARARSGAERRLKTDLTKIITEAADQAARLKRLIERDGRLRLHRGGWLDVSHVREIHTIAVSIEDLLHVATASVELVRAGLAPADAIPWTVSLHDLELIVELVTRPAEFLLYVRRRRDVLTNSIFNAPDELDLFMLMLDGGLRAEPDPDEMQAAFMFADAPTAAVRRTFAAQRPTLVTSLTDRLDRWYYTSRQPGVVDAPPPRMRPSPTGELVDQLADKAQPGWLSLGATLLGEPVSSQQRLATRGQLLFESPTRGRTVNDLLAQTPDPAQAWVVMWAAHPAGADLAVSQQQAVQELRAKLGEWGVARGAVLVYGEETRSLLHVEYSAI